MSCGKPHETPCTEVLDRVYGYIDGEISDLDCAKIKQHLDECGPCLREYGLEEAVKKLVQKHCRCDPDQGSPRDYRVRRVTALAPWRFRFAMPCGKCAGRAHRDCSS
jgi:mycothiol system anti-sigma-R factor